jgi:hypothetical protein
MKNENYFLCSQAVIDHFPNVEHSKPFKSGWMNDNDNYYVAILDFDKVQKHYNELSDEIDFWCRECVPGTMDVSKIRLSGAKNHGLFKEIEIKIGLTTERNRAMTIYELSEKFNCTPIEFINKITV